MSEPFDEEKLIYLIALTQVKHLGHANARKLLEIYGSPKELFSHPKSFFHKIKLSRHILKELNKTEYLLNAEKELLFIQKNKIQALTLDNENYPERLKQCYDAPNILYMKGTENLNRNKIICIVGTRNASQYGKALCEQIISEFKDQNMLVISGLAYGIDSTAHKSSLKYGINTAAVIGHGLHYIYPRSNTELARNILSQGSIITDFPSFSPIVPGNFVSRNRIIAGLSDACLVVESKQKGGSLITADFAHGYNREVFAIPGKPSDHLHQGPNKLIKENKAALVENATDILQFMSWENEKTMTPTTQLNLFDNLNDKEIHLLKTIQNEGSIHIDILCKKLNYNLPSISGLLLDLELKNKILRKPGNSYVICP